MPDREKVIKGLEYCMGGCQVSCFKCPYRDPGEVPPDCLDNCRILQDAVELLKEQEPIEAKTMGESKSHGSWWFACGACGHAIDPEDNFCRECGRKVKWNETD